MLEGVSRECGVVHLDIHLEVLVQSVRLEESDDRLRVHVVLVLGGFHGLGLDEEGASESLGAGIVACLGKHHGQVFLLAFLVSIEQTHVSLASAPEDVVLATQFDGCVDSVLNLHRRACHHIKVGVGSRTVHVALVSKHVGRAPQEFDARLLLFLLGIGHHLLKVGLVLLDAAALAHEVHVVEAVVADTYLLHELEARVHLVLGSLQWLCGGIPGEVLGASAKLVTTLGTQRMPPRHGEAQPVLHLLAHDDLIRVVVAECHGVSTLASFVLNLTDSGEKFFCHDIWFSV